MDSFGSTWARLHRRLVRGWMVVGAIMFGVAQSPTYAQLMQSRGEMTVIVTDGASTPASGEDDGPQALRPPTPRPSFDPCGDLGGLDPTEELLASLENAAVQQSIAGMRAALPPELHAGFDDAIAAPRRFYTALLGDLGINPPIVPAYILGDQPVAGEAMRALTNAAHGFDVTFHSVEKLDLAWGMSELQDPTLAPGEWDAAWDVTGVGERNGAVAEFTGMVVATKTPDGTMHVLIVETDSICHEPEPLLMFAGAGGDALAGELPGVHMSGSLDDGGGMMGGGIPHGLMQDPQDPRLPPGLPPLAWPGMPDIGDFGPLVWNQDCVRNKIQEYERETFRLLRDLADKIKKIHDRYYATAVRIVKLFRLLQRIRQALRILKSLRNCLVLLVFGWWGALACIAEVILTEILVYYIWKLIVKIILRILWMLRAALIRAAILAWQWLMYHLYNRIMSDIWRDCWTGPRGDGLPVPYPQIPQPPWWPVDPNGPYRPR